MLRSEFLTAEQVEAIVRGEPVAGLSPQEMALIAFAEKVTLHAYRVTPEDIEGLKRHGFSDEEIFDVAAATAARSFFSKILDAVGAEPDAKYNELETPLRKTLTVGRRFGAGDR